VEIGRQKIDFMKPQKFMNRSGMTVVAVKKKHPDLKNEDIYIIHDDLDIELGEYKLSFGRGPKDHNGLKSVYEQLRTKDFWHVRMGIDNRMKIPFKGSGEEYVLNFWLPEEKEMVDNVISQVVKELKDVFA
jgi:PTH1 family peptidyl-tRNA hydrolase